MKRIVLKTPIRLELKYKRFLQKLILRVNAELKKRNNPKYFTDSEMDLGDLLSGLSVNEIVDFMEEHFRAIKSGVDIMFDLGAREFNKGEKEVFSLLIEQNVATIASLVTDYRKKVGYEITQGLLTGEGTGTIARKIRDASEYSFKRAELIAITETARANTQFGLKKMEEFGIKNAIWSSAKDKRVRPSHLVRSGTKYEASKGCFSRSDGRFISTGQEPRCRCSMIIYL